MGETTVVKMAAETTPPAGPTPPPAPEQKRPDGLPEKFKTVDELVKAYGELEAKQSQPKDPPKPPEPQPKGQIDALSPEQKLATFTEEFTKNGKLSDESYGKLAELGYPKSFVDRYIAGVQAEADAQQNKVFEAIGGTDEWNKLAVWAASNLPEAEITQLNKMLAGPDATVAAQALQARYYQKNPKHPSLVEGGNGKSNDVYNDVSELIRDQSSNEYKVSESFRQKVKDKLNRSPNL